VSAPWGVPTLIPLKLTEQNPVGVSTRVGVPSRRRGRSFSALAVRSPCAKWIRPVAGVGEVEDHNRAFGEESSFHSSSSRVSSPRSFRELFADPAPAPSPGGAPGMYDAALGVPETGAAVSNNGGPVSVDGSTGTASVSVPFALPPARGHAQPQLGLTYNSATGKAIGGYGWNLDLPYIERAPLLRPAELRRFVDGACERRLWPR
jgi:hypothetical protein